MRQRRNVLDTLHVHARRLQRGNGTLATTSWPLHPNIQVFHPKLGRFFSSLLGCQLAGEGGSLPAALEATGATACPAERIAPGVSDRHRRVIEGRIDESDARGDALLFRF